ncbi:MAG: hypothetical protein JRN20_04525 [Nitrososphaerota archaeon]|nr:hypothetical protein [Nitrososphaerota archaeon]
MRFAFSPRIICPVRPQGSATILDLLDRTIWVRVFLTTDSLRSGESAINSINLSNIKIDWRWVAATMIVEVFG